MIQAPFSYTQSTGFLMQSLHGNFAVFALTVGGEGHVCWIPAHHCDVQLAHVKVDVFVDPKGKLAEELLMLAGEKFCWNKHKFQILLIL